MALNEGEIAIVKGMLVRGDPQHDIAAYFGINGGRIAEISTGQTEQRLVLMSEVRPPHQRLH